MDWWAYLNMLKTTLQRLVIKLMNTGYLRVFALFYFVNWDDVYISLLSIWENDEMSCFGGSFNIEAHLADAVLHSMWVLFSSLEFQLRVTEFSKVRKSSAQRKIAKVLSQWKLKYNITGRNFSDLCDFNDNFLYKEGKFIGNVSSVNGRKVWLFVEVTSTSDILISDYFAREKCETFESWFVCETWLTTSTGGLYMEIIF